MKTSFIIQIKNGKIGFVSAYNKARFNQYLKDNDGQRMKVVPVSPKVSDEARGYYWGAVIPWIKNSIQSFSELTNDQVHEIMKTEFNGFEVNFEKGGKKKYGQTIVSKDSDSVQFQSFLLRVADHMMENYSQELPDPELYKKLRDGVMDNVKVDYPEAPEGEIPF